MLFSNIGKGLNFIGISLYLLLRGVNVSKKIIDTFVLGKTIHISIK